VSAAISENARAQRGQLLLKSVRDVATSKRGAGHVCDCDVGRRIQVSEKNRESGMGRRALACRGPELSAALDGF